jgi:hypothetical protein
VGQPFVWGLVRGSIYVPPSFLAIENPEHRRGILAHELSHVLRFDAAVNTIEIIAQAIFWFHPLVWWANRAVRREREKCCDEMVIARFHTAPKDYSTAVLETLARARESARPAPSLAVAGPLRHIEERIRTLLRPGRRFYGRPTLATAIVTILAATLAVPTALVLTARAQAGDSDVNDVLAKYEAARKAGPSRYLMLVRSERELSVNYQDGTRSYQARYPFAGPRRAGRVIEASDGVGIAAQERAKAGDTISSLLAWAGQQTPESVAANDGTQGCSLWSDGFGHFDSSGKETWTPDYWPCGGLLSDLQDFAWPWIGRQEWPRRLVSDDRYALDNHLICLEVHEKPGPDESFQERFGRYYLNPARDYICQRSSGLVYPEATEITDYAQTPSGQWYPLRISEFYFEGELIANKPNTINTIFLDTNPTFPQDIFNPDALLARYTSLLVPESVAKPPGDRLQPNASQRRVAGRVLAGETRRPIANALVRIAIPAVDMRYIGTASERAAADGETKPEIYETRTDPNGWFEMLVPVGENQQRFAIDALAPGYGTAAANDGSIPDLVMLTVPRAEGSPGPDTSNLTILLPRTLYVAGMVKDAQGAPAAGVPVEGTVHVAGVGYVVANTQTDAQGCFEIFDFPLRQRPGDTAELVFNPSDAASVTVNGLHDMSDQARASLLVTLPLGLKITGVLLDAEGRPATGVKVTAMCIGGTRAHPSALGEPPPEFTLPLTLVRHTTTDAKGRFTLRGLESDWLKLPGSTLTVELTAWTADFEQRVVQPVTLSDHDEDVTLRMERVGFKGSLTPVTLFGMQLVSTPPELRDRNSSDFGGGLLVLDPGPQRQRLGLGEFQRGYRFSTVGSRSVFSLKDMVKGLLEEMTPARTKEASAAPQTPYQVQISYRTRGGSSKDGSMTLTPEDVEELKKLAEQLGVTAAGADR